MLKKSFKYQLKASAHDLKPVILMGTKGLTPAVLLETEQALLSNELIKIKLAGVEREDKMHIAETICTELHAELIQIIGNIAVIYRKKPEEIKAPVKTNRQGQPITKKRVAVRGVKKHRDY